MTPPPDLSAADEQTCLATVAALATSPPDALAARDTLLSLLPHASMAVRRRAAEALARLSGLDESVRISLRPLLATADSRRRWGAAYALALVGENSAELRAAVEHCLGDDDPDVRWAAVALRCRLSGPAESDGLVRLLRHGTPLQRRMAAYCLRQVYPASTAAADAVLRALEDSDAAVRLAACAAAVRLISDVRRLDAPLERLLADRDPRVQRAAAARCGEVSEHSERLVAALRRATANPDPALRRAAAGALQRLGRPRRETDSTRPLTGDA